MNGTARSCATDEGKGRRKEGDTSDQMNHRAEVMSFILNCFVCVFCTGLFNTGKLLLL